jgi:methyl-accepting chemotaxis protein
MENMKDLLIVEMSSNALSVENAESKDYVLEGIFGEIDVKNKNQRIYTEDEYVPQIEALQQKIKSGKLLGELDHPSQFDVSLKNVSHVIEDLHYDSEKKQVRGRIRLLDTDAGRQAKALVDAGVPLQISSRAAGAVESNGKVKIKQLFTYDLVADPGFENAELKRVNESYGFTSEGGLYIYEINKEQENITTTQIIENQEMADFVKANDFNKYTEYLANEIKSLKEAIETTNQPVESEVSEADLNAVKEHNDHIVENFNNLSEYIKYLAEKLDQSIQYSEHVAEKADQGIQYSEEVAEKLDQSIQYSEHVAEKLDQSIQYSEHLAEGMEKVKEYANYLAEAHNENTTSGERLIEYVDYLKQNLQSVTEYAEYIAESINENLVVEELDKGKEDEGAAKDMKEIEKKDSKVGNNAKEGDVEGEELSLPAEEIEAEDTKVNTEADKKTTDTSAELEADLEGDADDAGKKVVSATEAYKNEISNKLSSLVEAATKKENENPSFFKIVSSSVQEKYNALNEDAKTEVRRAVSKRGFMTESQIESIIESSNLIVENRNAEPFFITAMPVEYKEAWETLSESKKNQIMAQSKYHKLGTEYQVRNFWQTRDLRESAPVMEKIEMVKESKEEEKKGLGYDVTSYAEQFKKRFNK